jgi:hypothetical protein
MTELQIDRLIDIAEKAAPYIFIAAMCWFLARRD